jgi:hypothetical protein
VTFSGQFNSVRKRQIVLRHHGRRLRLSKLLRSRRRRL